MRPDETLHDTETDSYRQEQGKRSGLPSARELVNPAPLAPSESTVVGSELGSSNESL